MTSLEPDHDTTSPAATLPPTIPPEAALRPGRADPLALITIWFVRKSFYWLFFLGLISLTLARQLDDTTIDWTSPSSLWRELLSPLAGVILALVCRFAASQVGLALAYPLAKRHDENLEPRTSFGSSIGVFFDRLNVMRAYRSLRWTHHVRQVALGRLGRLGDRLGKLDPIMDVANIAMGVLLFVVLAWVGADTAA